MLVRLLYANIAVFLAIKLLALPFWLFQTQLSADQFALNWLAVPSDLTQLLFKPWTLLSYMFLHLGFIHILFNMIGLYFLGQLFVQLLGEKKLWTLYISGGIAGALLYIIFFNVFPVFESMTPFSKMLGASASVFAIVSAVGTYAPDLPVRMLFFGNVKLKYIAGTFILISFLNITKANPGGNIAHIGGALLGFFFAREWRKGKDITAWVNTATAFVKAIFTFKKKSRMKVKYKKSNQQQRSETRYEYNSRKKEEQEQVDAILDKISRSGYDSLTKAEKDFLFRASGK